jgi:hypothetical protein
MWHRLHDSTISEEARLAFSLDLRMAYRTVHDLADQLAARFPLKRRT